MPYKVDTAAFSGLLKWEAVRMIPGNPEKLNNCL
jgi:hypothetical protein